MLKDLVRDLREKGLLPEGLEFIEDIDTLTDEQWEALLANAKESTQKFLDVHKLITAEYEASPLLPRLLAKLPERFQWTLHNLVAHPVSELLFQVGLTHAADRVHDLTSPVHVLGTGRG